MNTTTFKFGDRVIHTSRPDWGHGTITRAESAIHDGQAAQRLHIRFAGAGLKVINTAMASLVMADEAGQQLEQPMNSSPSSAPVVKKPATSHEPPIPFVSPEKARNTVNRTPRDPAAPSSVPSSAQNSTPPRNGNVAPARPSSSSPPAPQSGSGWLGELEKNNPEDVMLKIPEYARDPFRSMWERLQSSINLYRFSPTPRGILDWAVAQSGLEDPLTCFNRQELETLFNRWQRFRDLHLFEVLEETEKRDSDRARQMLAAACSEAQQAMRRLYARR